ncbi:sigma factor binding protein 1, chloroplastic-like [Mangifera indica]|uniref:sigma factor binding protein 1, chloroplastic-like n=1 Tax=Mangifera indica TaxID=29780 RepID=UPI001CFA014C|nr:sigma factor binding protein 1, chloroplastic-like [Mangifera indica]
MDVLGVNNQIIKPKSHKNKRSKKGVKVVYISSPLKVKTCASNFRALVQELTGKDSDADANTSASRLAENPPSSNKLVDGVVNYHLGASTESSSPTVSALEMEFIDDVFMQHKGSFLGMFTSNVFSDSPYSV